MSSEAKVILFAAIFIIVILLSVVLSIKGFITFGQHLLILGFAMVGNLIADVIIIKNSMTEGR